MRREPHRETGPTAELVQQLGAIGVAPGMVLVVHTSFRHVRPVEGGPMGLIDALSEALGPRRTLVMPTMSGSRACEKWLRVVAGRSVVLI